MKDIKEQDLRILKNKISFLTFISGVSIYCDPTAPERRKEKGKNMFSLVNANGTFQVDDWNRFFYEIRLNELGLFELTYQGVRDDASIYDIKDVRDFDNNKMDFTTFQKFLTLLKNRKKTFLPHEYYLLEQDIKDSIFRIVNKSNVWIEKEGSHSLKWGKREDGLEYLDFETHERPDRYITHHEIRDSDGNQISLNDYYYGFIMLENGRSYLKELRSFVEYRV